MVATSQPLAVEAGVAMLAGGGNAADAAVTAVAMLSVLEPMMSGVGGDCFALHFAAGDGGVTALNGSGRAPAAASLDALREHGLAHMPEFDGRAVSVPGAVAGWTALLARHGSVSLADALAPAIRAARDGFRVTPAPAALWAGATDKLLRTPHWNEPGATAGPPQPSGAELLPGGRAPRAGEVVRLPELAATLEGIAAHGADYVYRGEFATRAAAHVQRYGGWLTAADLAAHAGTWDDAIHARYRDLEVYQCPPNGQGLATLLALGMADGFDLGALDGAERTHLMIECMRLALADAQRWVADPRAAALPLAALLDPRYAGARRRSIDPRRAAAHVSAGTPADTVYVAAVDAAGNACSLINSLFRPFGTGLVVPGTGVALHNRAALFSLEPGHPNALAPGKRPFQTIIPALSLHAGGEHRGALHACFGVVGAHMQPQGQFQILVNLLDLGLDPQQALDAPRWQLPVIAAGAGMQAPGAHEPGGRVLVEAGWDAAALAALARRGHRLRITDASERLGFGSAQLIVRDPDSGTLTGASDPRTDGCAAGL